MTKTVANALMISNDFNLRPHHKRYMCMVFISTLLRPHNEWMLKSLIDWSKKSVKYIKNMKNDEVLAKIIFIVIRSWYLIGVS